MRKYIKYGSKVIFYFVIAFLFVQCQKDDITDEVISSELLETQENVSFLIIVVDESRKQILGATIEVNELAEMFEADENGVFQLNGLELEDIGTKVTVKKEGYHTQYKMLSGRSSSMNTMQVVLIEEADGLVGSTGEQVNLDGEGRLQLPSILLNEDGLDYTGDVRVVSHYFDPDDNEMLQEAPGNMIGINEENEYSILGSFGMYLIELSDPLSGNRLNLKSGQNATIYFPIAESQKADAPESVPLWSFDEDDGVWALEGQAILVDDMFVAEVSHFSLWNCDLPYRFVPFCATFVDNNQNPLVGLEIDFKVNNQRFGNDITDDEGIICGKVPVEEIVTIHYSFDGIIDYFLEVGPYASDALSEVIVLEGPISTSGVAVDCDMNPITNGYALKIFVDEVEPILIQPDGSFQYWKSTSDHTLRLVDLMANTFIDIEISATNESIDLGTIIVCEEVLGSLIKGIAMLDENEDGTSDLPVASAIIEVKNSATQNIDYSTTTAEDGTYSIFVLPNVEYVLSIISPEGMKAIYHGDRSPDDDDDRENWTDKTREGFLAKISDISEVDADNDFQLINDGVGTLNGIVMKDTDGDFIIDGPVPNQRLRVISYTEGTEDFVDIYTNESGEFNLETNNFIGIIKIIQNSILDFDESPDPDGDDSSEGANSIIPIRLIKGESDEDNNFIVNGNGSICGSVMEDTDNDDVGDSPIEGIIITLKQVATGVTMTTVCDENGQYCFTNLAPGEYTITEQDETEIDEDYVDVFDGDETPEDADDAIDGLNDDSIEVTLDVGENDDDNNFVEEQLGSISGSVKLDTNGNGLGDLPMDGMTIQLSTTWGDVISVTSSDENGFYVFESIESFAYIVSVADITGFISVSDYDEAYDGDFTDMDTVVDNMIGVRLVPGEDDGGNNFALKEE